jgi:hypothetical protein
MLFFFTGFYKAPGCRLHEEVKKIRDHFSEQGFLPHPDDMDATEEFLLYEILLLQIRDAFEDFSMVRSGFLHKSGNVNFSIERHDF